MQVQLNTTMPNQNFKARLTNNAQTFVNSGINRLCLLPEYKDWRKCKWAEKLVEGIVKYMKDFDPVDGPAEIDMSESGDSLVCKIFKKGTKKLKKSISSMNIHENNILDVLFDFRNKLIPIKEEPCIRPDTDFIDEYGHDVRECTTDSFYQKNSQYYYKQSILHE